MAEKIRKLTSLATTFMVVVLVAAGFLQFYVVTPPVVLASPDVVTYYFDSYGAEVWETNPAGMTDGDTGTYASTNNANEVQLNNSNTCPGTDSGTISKVELRAYGYGDGGDSIYLRPVFTGGDGSNNQWTPGTNPGWSPYINITTDTNAPSPWTWSDVQSLGVDVQYVKDAGPNIMYIAKVEIQVTYSPGIYKSVSQGITMKNGKPATQGICPTCGTKMFRIGSKQ